MKKKKKKKKKKKREKGKGMTTRRKSRDIWWGRSPLPTPSYAGCSITGKAMSLGPGLCNQSTMSLFLSRPYFMILIIQMCSLYGTYKDETIYTYNNQIGYLCIWIRWAISPAEDTRPCDQKSRDDHYLGTVVAVLYLASTKSYPVTAPRQGPGRSTTYMQCE